MIDTTKLEKRPCVYRFKNLFDGKEYVGGTKSCRKRVCEHLNELRRGKHYNKHFQSAWNIYKEDGFTLIVEYCEKDQEFIKEQEVLDEKFSAGMLYNKYPYSIIFDDDIKQKMSLAGFKRALTPEQELIKSQKLSLALKGRIFTEEHKDNIRNAQTPEVIAKRTATLLANRQIKIEAGLLPPPKPKAPPKPKRIRKERPILTDEQRKENLRIRGEKCSRTTRGRKQTPERIAIMKASLARPEVKLKIRAASDLRKGRKQSPETIAKREAVKKANRELRKAAGIKEKYNREMIEKLRILNTGRKHTEEACEKMSESQKNRWQNNPRTKEQNKKMIESRRKNGNCARSDNTKKTISERRLKITFKDGDWDTYKVLSSTLKEKFLVENGYKTKPIK